MKYKYKIISIFIFIVSFSKSQVNQKQVLDSLFFLYENENKLFGSAELMKDDQALYQTSIGWRDIKKKYKNDSLTLYPIAAITELFTLALVFQLDEKRKLSLSDKLSKYYPEIPNSEKITLKSMLRRSSGLAVADTVTLYNTEEKAIQYLKEHPTFEKNRYSNFDYFLLGFIIEKVSGQSFDLLLTSEIINKTGLQNTYYGELPPKDQLSISYYKKDGSWRKYSNQSIKEYKYKAGIYSTPHEVNLFISALYQGRLFNRKYIDKYLKEKNRSKVMALYYRKESTGETYSLLTRVRGFRTQVEYREKEKVSICIISNADENMNLNFLIQALEDFYHGKTVKFPDFSLIKRWKEK